MKDPKQKAIELFEKARPMAHANLFSFREESFNNNCRKIALMVVNEILDPENDRLDCDVNYYEQVKQELEKM